MDYFEILERLRKSRNDSAADALEHAVREEAKVLLDLREGRRTEKAIALACESARKYYAEDITTEMETPRTLKPEHVLNFRRIPTAWAVARILRGI